MAEKEKVSTSERLAALMTDRERYQLWLKSLEGERDTIPDHVYTRVHGDYTTRLEEVTQELASHVEALRSMLVQRKAALDEADAAVSARTDELLEAEVRFRIGEFDDGAWAATEKRLQQKVAEAEKNRDKLNAQIERLADALEQLAEGALDAAPAGDVEVEDDPFLRRLIEESAKAGAESGAPTSVDPPVAKPRVPAPKPAAKKQEPARKRAEPTPKRAEAAPPGEEDTPPKPLRTIECGRCGTFNFPDAVHCDACGEALAA